MQVGTSSDLTFGLNQLEELRPGAIDEILATLAQLDNCLVHLHSAQCLAEFAQARTSEVRQRRRVGA